MVGENDSRAHMNSISGIQFQENELERDAGREKAEPQDV